MADQGTEGFLSPFLRNQRIKAVKPYLKGRVLDVGCGSGSLAKLIDPMFYVGIEIDDISLTRAKKRFPHYFFRDTLPLITEKFDTVVLLAVIEHVSDPSAFLKLLAQYLNNSSSAHIVLTTPHPSIAWFHEAGASVGLFSKHANEEHEELLDKKKLNEIGQSAGLTLVDYRRFLVNANQLAVFKI